MGPSKLCMPIILGMLFLFMAPATGFCAIAVDGTSSSYSGSSVSSLTWSHTVTSNANGILIVGVSDNSSSSTVSSVTYNGVALTRIGSVQESVKMHAEMWRLLAPATGTHSVVVNMSSSPSSLVGGAASFTGVDQTTPYGAFASASGDSTTAAVTVATSSSSQLVVDTVAIEGSTTGTRGASQTELWHRSTGSDGGSGSDTDGAGSREAGTGGNVNMSWSLGGGEEESSHNWAIGAIALNQASSNATTLGTGSDPGNATLAPGGAATMADAFTLQTSSGSDTVTTATVTLAAGTYAGLGLVEITNDAGTTVYGSVANPSSNTPSISLTTNITATTTPTQYKIRITPMSHANMPAPPGSTYAVTAYVSGWSGTNAHAGSDSGGTTVTIDNQSPANVTGASAAPGGGQVSLDWTNPADADLSRIVVLRLAGSAVTNTPVEGTDYSVGNTIGSATVACVVTAPASACTDTGLSNGTAYYYKIFTMDASNNYSATGVALGPATPVITTTLGTGTDPGNAALAPGGAATPVDAFTFQTSSGTDTVTAATLALSAGSAAGLSLVEITSSDGATVYGSLGNPGSDTPTITLNTNTLTATTSLTSYSVRITPKSHASMPAPAGSSYAVTAYLSNWTGSNAHGGSDAGGTTVTIDNLSPANVSVASVSVGDTQLFLDWTNPGDADLSRIVVLRRTVSAVTDVPVEGTGYAVGNLIGSSTVACVVTAPASACTDTGLTNGTAYYYKIFTMDANNNYSATGVVPTGSPATPIALTTTLGTGTDPGNTTLAPDGSATMADAFTFQTNIGTDTITDLTVTLAAGSAAGLSKVEITSSGGGTVYGSVNNPGSDTPTITLSTNTLSATTSLASYKIRITPKSHASMPVPPGSSYPVTAYVSNWTGSNTQAGSDTGGTTVTIDNLSPAEVTAASTAVGDTQISLDWTNPADVDLSRIVVLRRAGSAVADVPVEGASYSVGDTIGSSRVACVVTSPTSACTSTGLTNGTAYYYKIFTRDTSKNYSANGVALGPTTPTSLYTAVGDGSDPSNSTIAPGGAAALVDTFTFQTSGGTDIVSDVTLNLTAGSAAALSLVEITSSDGATVYGSVANPGSDTPTITLNTSTLTATSSAVSYRIRITPKSHASMPAPPGSSYAVTAYISNWTCANIHSGSDTGATVTIDNLSPANVTGASATPGGGEVSLNWTNPADADLSRIVVLRLAGSAVTDTPVEGANYSVGNTIGSSTVACVVTSPASACTDTGLSNGTAYYYKIFTMDASNNYSATGVALGPTVPVITTTLGTGSDPGNTTLAPGGVATVVDAFTFQASSGTDTITAATLTFSAGSAAGLSLVEIVSSDGATVYGSVVDPGSDTPAITLNTNTLTATTSLASYSIRLTPKSHANMPAPPGASYAVTAYLSNWTGTNNHGGSDTGGATVTIDNLSPANVTVASASASDTQVFLDWTNPADADLSRIVVLRRTGSAVADTPVEGASYAVGDPIGSSTVACVVTSPASACADTGLTNGTAYYYKIFTMDASNNYSANGVIPTGSPATPLVVVTTLGTGTDPGNVTLAPGGAATMVDAFTFQTSSSTETITDVTVTLAVGSAAGLSKVEITSSDGTTVYGSVTNPGSDTPTITLNTNTLTTTTTLTSYRIRITPKSHANMPAPSGSSYPVTAHVSNWTGTNSHAGSDTGGTTVTIDNLSPANVTGASSSPSGEEDLLLDWTNPGDADLSRIIVLRNAGSAVTDVPVEGASYSVGNTIGSSRVACVVSSPTSSCTDNDYGSSYYYKIFTKDANGNYSADGVALGRTTTLGNGTDPGNTTLSPGGAATLADAFTFQTSSGSETVTNVTVALAAGSAAGLSKVEITSSGGGTVYGSVSNPGSDTPTITLNTNTLSATTSATSYSIRITPKSHANMPVPAGSSYAVTAYISSWTSNNIHAGSDTGGTTVTIDNLSPGNASVASAAAGNTQVSFSWTNPADADLGSIVILRRAGSAVADAPIEGASYTVGNTFGSSTVACVTASPGTSCTNTGLTNGTAYYYKIFTKDTRGNYATGLALGPATPNLITLGTGSDPANAAPAPGGAATMVDAFTFQASSGTETITAVTVTLAAGSYGALSLLEITDNAGSTVYGSVSNPGSDTPQITLDTNTLNATTTSTQYKIRITPKSHADMPAPAGSSYPVTAYVSNCTGTSAHAGSDTGGTTVTIDNLSPGNVTGASASAGNAQVSLNWTDPADADLGSIVVLRGTALVTDVPTEGTGYLVGNAIGSATVACVVASPGVSCTDTGLSNGTAYYYKIFTRDASGNYSATGVAVGPATPNVTTLGTGSDPGNPATLAPEGAATMAGAFTLQTSSGSDTISAATVTLAAGSSGALSLLEITDDAGATVYGSLANPGSDTPTITLNTNTLSATTSATQYKIRITPKIHTGMPVPPGSSYSATAYISNWTGSNAHAGSDTGGTTVTIDNLSPGNATVASAVPGDTLVSLSWTNPADADLGSIVVLRKSGAAVADAPTEGAVYAAGNVIGASTVACVVASPASSCPDTGLSNGTAYYYKIFAKDSSGNYATGAAVGPATPTNAAVTDLGPGTDPADAGLAPAGAATMVDAFSFQTSTGTDIVTNVTVTLAAGSYGGLSLVEITNSDGTTVYGSVNPGSDTPIVTLNTNTLTATTASTPYKIRITPKLHAAMPAPAGSSYPVTAYISNWTGTNIHSGGDTGGTTVTIDNLSPGNATGEGAADGNTQVSLNWTNPADADLGSIVVLRGTVAVADVPVEGATYIVGNTVGAATVGCVTASPGSSCTDTGLSNGTAYYYKIFTRDTSGNYATGVALGPVTPTNLTTLGTGVDPGNAVLAPEGAATMADAFTFQTSSGSETVTAATVTLAAGSHGGLSLVEITNDAGTTVYGSLSDPVSETPSITLNTNVLSATTTLTQYKIRITPKSHAGMPAPPGSSYPVTAYLSSWTGTNAHAGSDTGGTTVTLDNLSPGNVTGAGASAGNTQVSLNWSNPADADLGSVVVLRGIALVTDLPTEGASYLVGNAVGSATVACVVASPDSACSDTGLVNTTAYYYKIFTRDTSGNYSAAGVALGPATPNSYQPDAMIKNNGEADVSYLAANVYEASASAQAKAQSVVNGTPASYLLKFVNNGTDADDLKITGTATGSGFTVEYLDETSTDRTAAVTGAGYTIAGLAAAGSKVWTLKVTPDATVVGGTSYEVAASATSVTVGANSDQVKATTTSSSPVLVLIKSADKGSCRPGENITFTVTASNGAGLSSASSVVITDPIPTHTGFMVGGASFSAGTSTLTADYSYSDDAGTSYLYSPASGGCSAPAGYDYCVTNIRWTMTGSMPSATSFSVGMVVQVK